MKFGSKTGICLLGIVVVGVALYTHWPLRHVFFSFDLLAFSQFLTFASEGKRNYVELLLGSWGSHYLPLWQVQVALEHWLFQLDPVRWQLATAGYQAVSALLLFVWLRGIAGSSGGESTWESWIGPAAGAILWSGAIAGGREEVAMTPFEGHYPVTLSWILAALVCGERFAREKGRWWAYLALGFTVLGALTWEIGMCAAPMLGLQHILLGGFRRPGARIGWRLTLTAVVVLTTVCAWLVFMKIVTGQLANSTPVGITDRPYAVLRHFAEAFARLVGFRASEQPIDWQSLSVTAAGAALSVLFRRRHWQAAAIAGLLPVFTVSAAVSLRGPESHLLSDYLYYPTFFWCVWLGLVVDATIDRFRRARWLIFPTTAVLVVAALVHQNHKAAIAAREFAKEEDDAAVRVREYRRVLVRLGGLHPGEKRRIPNLPLVVQKHFLCYTTSWLVDSSPGGLSKWFDVVDPDRFSVDEQRRLEEDLRQIGTATSIQWSEIVKEVGSDARGWAWSSDQLTKSGRFVSLPVVLGFYDQLGAMVSLPINFHWLFDRRLDGIRMAPSNAALDPNDVQTLGRLGNDGSLGFQAWSSLYDRWFRTDPMLRKDIVKLFEKLKRMREGVNLVLGVGCKGILVNFYGDAHTIRVDDLQPGRSGRLGARVVVGPYRFIAGRRYEFRFRAPADESRPATIRFARVHPDSSPFGDEKQVQIQSNGWTEYVLATSAVPCELFHAEIDLGSDATPVEASRFKMTEDGSPIRILSEGSP